MGSPVGPAPVQVTADSSSRTHSLRHSFVKTVQMSGLEDLGPLPEGWTLKWHGVGNTRRPYFINHHTRQTTWDDPRTQRNEQGTRNYNTTPNQSQAKPTQSQGTPKQREPAKATLSDEEVMAKAIAMSMAEEEQRKKQAASMQQPKPMPSQTYRPTTETSFNNESNSYSPEMASANFANFSNDNRSPFTAAADSNDNALDSVPATQSDARAKGPNPDLLMSERVEAKGPDPSLCQGPMGLAKGP